MRRRSRSKPKSASKSQWSTAMLPFLIAAVSILVAWASVHSTLMNRELVATICVVVFLILLFDLPICATVLLDWIQKGRPPAVSFWPFLRKPEEPRLKERE